MLTHAELNLVTHAMPEDASVEEREAVIGLVSSLKIDDGTSLVRDEAVKTGSREILVSFLLQSPSDDFLRELQAACPRLNPDYLDSLLDTWDRANKRLFLFYDSAAKAYFAYLKFSPEVGSGTVNCVFICPSVSVRSRL